MSIVIAMKPGYTAEAWGFIPGFLDLDDPRTAQQQIDANYVGGWTHMPGFELVLDTMTLTYGKGEDSDPPLVPLGALFFREEMLVIYDSAWVVIVQPDKSWTVARLD